MTQAETSLAPLLDPDARREAVGAAPAAVTAVSCVLQIVLAYEWLVSGLDKLANRHFDSQLVSLLQQGSQGSRYGWYVSLLRTFVLPNHTVFALLVQVTEPAVGLALLMGGALGLFRPHTRIAIYGALAASAALLGSTLLCLNYFFQGDCPVPSVNPSNSFVPGVSINIFVALISLVLLVTNLRWLTGSRSGTADW